jgi:hypothetical protein
MDPYNAPASETGTPSSTPQKTHCGLGITSFILTIVSFIAMILVFGYAGYMQTTTPGGIQQDSGATIMIGLITILLSGGLLVGVVLGIVSLCRKNKKKLFGILGLSMSLFAIVLVTGLIGLGLAINNSNLPS